MRKTVIFFLCCALGCAGYLLFPKEVYVTPAETQIDIYSGEKTLHFWVSNQHRELFQIGKVYLVAAEQQQKQLVLTTIAFAEIKPDSLKLGFRLAKNDKFTVEATEYLINEIFIDNTTKR